MLKMKSVVVVFSDKNQSRRAEKTIRMVRREGAWKGDVVWVAIHVKNFPSWTKELEILVRNYPPLLMQYFEEFRKKNPFCIPSDGRETNKLIQFSKWWVFDPWFRENYDSLLYLDAGMHVFQPLFPWFQLPHKNAFLAPDDRYPFDDLNKKFMSQWDTCLPPLLTDLNHFLKAKNRNKEGYFLNCVWLMCTSLIKDTTIRELLSLAKRFPISRTNEMAIMNLYFEKCWKPIPQPFYFDWTNRNSHKENESILIKYPRS